MRNSWHVYPVSDLLPHKTKGLGCLCHPTIKRQPNNANIIVHNSFDGRELKEPQNKLKIN